MDLVVRLVLMGLLVITGCRALEEIIGQSVSQSGPKISPGAKGPWIGPSTSQLSLKVGANYAHAHGHVTTEPSLEPFGMHMKYPSVEYLGGLSTHQLGPQRLTKTAVCQDGAQHLSNLKDTGSQLKRNRDSPHYSSLLPSSNQPLNRRLSLNGNINEVENETLAFRHLNDENNLTDNSIDLKQPVLDKFRFSSDIGRPYDSSTSMHNSIAREGVDQFPSDLLFDSNMGTLRGGSDISPTLNDNLFPDILSLQHHAFSRSMLSQNAFSSDYRHGLNAKALDYTQGFFYSTNSDHIPKSDRSRQSENYQDSSKPWRLASNQNVLVFGNPEYRIYSKYVDNLLKESSHFRDGILVQGPNLRSFFTQFFRIRAESPEEIASFGAPGQMTCLRRALYYDSWILFLKERETWFKFFVTNYNLKLDNARHDLTQPCSIFPIYLFYVKMINEIIPPAESDEEGIASACVSYQDFIHAPKQKPSKV